MKHANRPRLPNLPTYQTNMRMDPTYQTNHPTHRPIQITPTLAQKQNTHTRTNPCVTTRFRMTRMGDRRRNEGIRVMRAMRVLTAPAWGTASETKAWRRAASPALVHTKHKGQGGEVRGRGGEVRGRGGGRGRGGWRGSRGLRRVRKARQNKIIKYLRQGTGGQRSVKMWGGSS
jgi:hypothetical protein